jgi:hypothetical protein
MMYPNTAERRVEYFLVTVLKKFYKERNEFVIMLALLKKGIGLKRNCLCSNDTSPIGMDYQNVRCESLTFLIYYKYKIYSTEMYVYCT